MLCLLVSLPDQSLLLQPLPEDEVFGEDVTQQEVIFLLLCGNKTQSDEAIARVSAAAAGKALLRWSANAPTGPVELVLMTLQKSVTGRSRKRLRQYSRYLGGERRGSRSDPETRRWRDTQVVLWQVSDQSDVADDQLVFQQKVFEEDVLLLQRDRLRTEEAHQCLRSRTLQTGSTGAAGPLLWETQRLQDAVLA